MKKKTWIGIGVVSLIILMVGVSVYRSVFAKGPVVQLTEVGTEEISSLLMIPGTLKLKNEQAVYVSPELGDIKKIHVKEGQQVKKGDVLATFENSQLMLEVEQNKLSIESGYSRINQIEKQIKELNKQKKDLTEQIGKKEAEKQLAPQPDQLDVEKRMANLDVKQSLLQKDLLEKRIKDLKITSLYDGTVISVKEDIHEGGTTVQEPVIVVGTIDTMIGTGSLSEYDVLKVKEGQKVVLQSDVRPEGKWAGEVEKVGFLPRTNSMNNQVEVQAVQYPVEIKITSKNIDLKPGFQLIMEIETEKKKSLVLPIDAVKYENNQTYVFLVENFTAQKVAVELGISSGDKIEIIEGLKEGDKLVLNPTDRIEDGMEVTIND